MARVQHEQQAIEPFAVLAANSGLKTFRGQGLDNRLPLDGDAYFQFGDLRVDLPNCHIILEVESAGGLTNLVKYWDCLESGRITRPVWLLHLFRKTSSNDYESHIQLWHFLSAQMCAALGVRLRVELFTYRGHEFEAPLSFFERWLREGSA